MRKFPIFSVVVMALVLVSGCDDEHLTSLPAKGDYFPASPPPRQFLREQFYNPDLADRYFNDTIRVVAGRDTVFDGMRIHRLDFYSMWDSGSGVIEVHDFYRFFRKEGSRYLSPSFDPRMEDHIFLDSEKPVGSSWSYLSFYGDSKQTYTVKAVNATRTFNGKLYRDVIEMEMQTSAWNTNGEEYLVQVSNRYFAKDIGEIYSLSSWYVYAGALRISCLE